MTKTLQDFVSNIKENSKNIKRNLRRFGLALAASAMIVSCQDCTPFPPSDLPPEATLTVDKTSVNKGESVNVKVNGTAKSLKNLKDANAKSDKFIVSYHLDADYDGNGTVDETIEQETPIDIYRKLDYVGKAKFSAMTTDNKGLTSDVKSLEVIVNENINNSNNKPIANLSSDKTSLIKGENANLGISGTDGDGVEDIKEYEIKIDYDGNGTVDEEIKQTNPFVVSRKFDILGTAKVYGKVTDSKNESDEKNLEIKVSNVPVTNNKPIANLSSDKTSLIKGENANLGISGTDGDGVEDIKEYEIKIDYDGNGTVDEEIKQTNPFVVSRKFDVLGTAKVYGKVTDSKNESDEKSLEIKILQFPLVRLSLSINEDEIRKGESVNISLNNLNENEIKDYIISIDLNDDGSIDEVIKNSSPLNIEKRFYNDRIRLLGEVEDKDGLKNSQSVLINPIEDIKINFEFKDNYNIGDYFDYKWDITNYNKDLKEIILDNSNKDSLIYEIYNKDKKIFGFNLDQNLILKLKRDEIGKEGMFYVQTEQDRTRFGINDYCSALWQGLPFWINGPFFMSYPTGGIKLNSPGDYRIELTTKYNLEGKDHTIKVISREINLK